ncbi:MAG: PadR family transcriptional regulator [Actinomycetota bacterium]|jgi:DNA-binding PadR family transcriptional regulator|nr:PadR family transcriptional regulator [Actinomycetota bacterium]
MMELAILGLLEEQEMHGYEIRRRLREELGLFANVSFGSLYPALSRLERSGALAAVEDDRHAAPVPMTGSLTGEWAALRARRPAGSRGRRGRKVYRLTDEGRRQFATLLATEPPTGDDTRSFGLRLAFARYLPPQARLRLLERRRAQLLDRLGAARSAAGGVRLDRYARSLVEHAAESIERDVHWLDRLIEAERAPGGAGDPGSAWSRPGSITGATPDDRLASAGPDPTARAVTTGGDIP